MIDKTGLSLNQSNNPDIYPAETGTRLGRGIFASRKIPAGQIVEVCPVVLLDLKTQPFPGTIRRLVYNWSKTHVALALGYGSLYNHSDQPNIVFRKDVLDRSIIFTAAHEIKAGEQLTISYDYNGPGINPRKKSWFEIHGVEQIEIGPKSNRVPSISSKDPESSAN